jgi:hypothetical protein
VRVVILVLIGIVALTSCSSGGIATEFYVVIDPDESAKFIEAVTSIAKEDGLATAIGQSVYDTGDVMRIVEGRGHGIKLWVQSMPLSGNEDPTLCGIHSEPYSDPAQFLVSTEPRFFGSKAAAVELGERMFFQIQKAGFDVRRESPVCGAAALHRRP